MSVEEVVVLSKARLEALLAPIAGGVGEDLSYDPAFEATKAEIDKSSSLDGGTIDWASVISQTDALLSERTKDYRLALYWSAGRATLGGAEGLLDALVLLNELADAFWEAMYPSMRRPRARGNLVSWFSDAVTPVVQALKPTLKDRDLCMAISEQHRKLDSELAEKLGEAYTGANALRDAVGYLVRRVPDEPPPPPPPKAVSEIAPASMRGAQLAASGGGGGGGDAPSTVPPAGGGGPSADDIVDVDSAYRVLGEMIPAFYKAAELVAQAAPNDPDAYRFSRMGAWLMISASPPDEEGVTRAEPPRPDLPAGLQELAAAQDWPALASAADGVTTQFPFWLDGARYLVTALENMGEEYARARDVVVRETGALLARCPNLPDLKFFDGMPMADDETKGWIASTVLAGGGGGGGGPAPKTPVDKAVRDAQRLAVEGQLPQALTLVSRALQQTSSPAARFRGRLAIANICLENNLIEIAKAHLEALERTLVDHKLAEWDPDLCAQLYGALYRTLRPLAENGDPRLALRATQVFDRLCQFDSAEAFNLYQAMPPAQVAYAPPQAAPTEEEPYDPNA